jgi:hypothetical protein
MKTLNIELCTAFVALSLASGCGSDGTGGGNNTVAISSGILAGKVGGQPWSLVSAFTDSFLSEGQSEFFVTAYAEQVDGCESSVGSNINRMILLIPKDPGDYALGHPLTATFVVDPGGTNQNLFATKGRIVVDEVTATSVRGGAAIDYDANNQVNGQFQVSVCP